MGWVWSVMVGPCDGMRGIILYMAGCWWVWSVWVGTKSLYDGLRGSMWQDVGVVMGVVRMDPVC